MIVLCPDQWQRLRAIRLLSLEDSPGSFAGHLTTEQDLPEQHWRDQLTQENWVVVFDNNVNEDVAVFSIKATDPLIAWLAKDADCWIHSCWIAPPYRGKGEKGVRVLPILIEFINQYCLQHNWRRQGLGVYTENTHAIKAYEKFGFQIIGDPQPSTKFPGRKVVALLKTI